MPRTSEFHDAMLRALKDLGSPVVVSGKTASTSDDARAHALDNGDDARHMTVFVTDHQTAGRGRLGRTWVSPPGLGLQASWIARPALPVERWTLIPLMAGVAAAEAVRARTKVDARLKWPNDLLVNERKLGGILVEAEPPRFAIVGLGINVSNTEFPPELQHATSIAIEGGIRLDRADLLAAAMKAFDALLRAPDDVLARYRALCVTLGRIVRVERTNADPLEGIARDVDDAGALVIETNDGLTTAASGDVLHVR